MKKVSKTLIAALAVFGASAAFNAANAIVLKANDNEFANVGLDLQIWAQNNGKVVSNSQSSNNFSINNARVYFSGEINPIVQFGANLDFADNNALVPNGTARAHQGTQYTRVTDAFINLKLMPELQVMAGLFRDPVSNLSNTDEYSYVIPTGFGYGIVPVLNAAGYVVGNDNALANLLNPFTPITLGGDVNNANRDAGIAIWGNVADTMLKYYLFATNGAYDYQAGLNGKGNLKYGIRLELTPTMLGYKNDPGFSHENTWLGSLNNLTLGLGYEQQKLEIGNLPSNSLPGTLLGTNSSLTPKYYDIDATWEQKFGSIVPQIGLGWAQKKDLMTGNGGNVKTDGYYAQVGLLYDEVVGLGKPGIAFRYENSRYKNLVAGGTPKIQRYGIFANYYIAGEAARVSLGADFVNPNGAMKNLEAPVACGTTMCGTGKNFTDYTLALQTEF